MYTKLTLAAAVGHVILCVTLLKYDLRGKVRMFFIMREKMRNYHIMSLERLKTKGIEF